MQQSLKAQTKQSLKLFIADIHLAKTIWKAVPQCWKLQNNVSKVA